jgi:hypothetical protein
MAKETDKNQKQDAANYDRHLTTAETAARMEREGEKFREKPESEGSIDTTGGYTVSREGLLNNYAIEPEMYVNEPGDLREKQEAEAIERAKEIEDVNTEGGKGPGII